VRRPSVSAPPTREPTADARQRGPLTAAELAEAAVLGDVTVALCLLGFLLPFGAVLVALAVVPMAALGARHRLRAVLAGALASGGVAMLAAGTGLAGNVVGCAVVGGFVGAAIRRGWGVTRALAATVAVLWPAVSAVALAVLAAFPQARQLALKQVTNTWRGLAKTARRLGLDRFATVGDHAVRWLVTYWPVTVVAGILFLLVVGVWVVYQLSRPTLRRVGPPPRQWRRLPDGAGAPAPVPVRLDDVRARYPGAGAEALAGVTLDVAPAELVAVVGPNGSGKSTLTRVLAGWSTAGGRVSRPGPVGLGQAGGTAMVFQRPETQVLGVRARDDVVWGLPPAARVDVAGLLARVGLDGFDDRETSTLSGGELQRLALAAAIARRPALLLSDESTAMVDRVGREQVVGLLRALSTEGTAVVHVTHRGEEAAQADRRFALEAGVLAPAGAAGMGERSAAGPDTRAPARRVVVSVRGLGHVYAAGTPWEHRALAGVDLDLRAGEGVLIVGGNGAGKSTLAWAVAGLLEPSEGTVDAQGGHVALSFQHARLQLLRATVRSDVRAASGTDAARADRALAQVGLDPAVFGDRRVDELSGGEQRRVALAGLLAGRARVLVLDEPFAGLDQEGRVALAAVLAGLRATLGLTLVVVSHDTGGLDGVVDRTVVLDGGRVVADSAAPDSAAPDSAAPDSAAPDSAAPAGAPSPPPPAPARRSRRGRELHLFRAVPGDTPMHRLWAGTKLVALLALAVALSINPSWPAIAIAAALLGTGLVVAHIPRGAAPRLPRWFWIGVGIGALLALQAGGPPFLHIGGLRVGVGALGDWARATSLAAALLLSAALVSWTTRLSAVAPALRKLLAPLRLVRLPVAEWTAAVALAIRCLPLLVDETRTLIAARRLRQPYRPHGRKRLVHEALDLLTAELVVALRRAGELATAIDARGGLGTIADDASRPGWRDAIALALVTVAVVVIVLL
jgi:energy-coupling factor transport system ATP-binding protein